MLKNDIDIIGRLKAGDVQAFREIFNEYYDPIKRNIGKFILNESDVEDVLQTVFIHLWLSREKLRDETNIGNWLFTVSYNRSMSSIRKTLVSKEVLTDDFLAQLSELTDLSDEEAIIEREALVQKRVKSLHLAIEKLPDKRKAAFVLKKIKGYSYWEVAQMMGISESSVRQYVKMATSTLTKLVQINEMDIPVLAIIALSVSCTVNNW